MVAKITQPNIYNNLVDCCASCRCGQRKTSYFIKYFWNNSGCISCNKLFEKEKERKEEKGNKNLSP